MGLMDLLTILRGGWRSIVTLVVICLAASALYLAMGPKQYSSRALVFFSATGAEDAGSMAQGALFVQNQIKSYPSLVTTGSVLDETVRRAGGGATRDSLAGQVSAVVPQDSTLLQVEVRAPDQVSATRLAQALAESAADAIQKLETRPDRDGSAVRAQIVDPASGSGGPDFPKPVPTLLAGLLVGLGAGSLAAFVGHAGRDPSEGSPPSGRSSA